MAYTVKQVAAMSGVSVRALHFYDETGLLAPAYHGANGYRFYEEAQLLTLQQILFYRELGFELKQIRQILGRADFEKVDALESHRNVLREKLARMHTLLETVDKTLHHLKGKRKMKGEELFAGFSVAAGADRFGDGVRLAGEPFDCKVSGKDTGGALCVFEITASGGGPPHRHHDQDEWIYVAEGEVDVFVGDKQMRLGPGESVFVPRNVGHAWACPGGKTGKVIDVYQPAGTIEAFFRDVDKAQDRLPTREEAINRAYTDEHKKLVRELFSAHGMDVLGPPPDPQ